MSVILWLMAGTAAGWIACSVLHLSATQGLMVLVIIGGVGVLFGGDATWLSFGPPVGEAASRSPFAVLVACIVGLACVKIVGVVYRHFHAPAIEARVAQTLS